MGECATPLLYILSCSFPRLTVSFLFYFVYVCVSALGFLVVVLRWGGEGGEGGVSRTSSARKENVTNGKKILKCKRESNKTKLSCPRGKPSRIKNTNGHCHGGSMMEDNKRSNRVHRTNVVEETSSVSEGRQLADLFNGRKLPVFRSRTRNGNPFEWRRKKN